MTRKLVVLVLDAALPAATSASAATRPTTVTVRMLDFRNVLSRTSVPVGTVRFAVVNRGAAQHDFAIAGTRTRLLGRGARQTLVVRFRRPGNYRFLCTLPGHAQLGMRGVLRVGRPTRPATPPAPAAPTGSLQATKIGDFGLPTDLDSPPGDASRLVVTQQNGLAHLVVDGVRREQPFLDLRERVEARGENGLLGIAFAPDYATSGLVYAYFNDRFGNLRLVELRRSALDPDRLDPEPVRELLYQVKFAANHNGGMLQFDGLGRLYVSVGDGGHPAGVPPGQEAQNRASVFGKVLRFDLATGTWEPWGVGLRNPWRFWHDRPTGRTYVADVGHDRREEINVVPTFGPVPNFGWPCFEGSLLFDETATCDAHVPPTHEYAHADDACSITGGVVVRDARIPWLVGAFLFGDLCAPTLSALHVGNGAPTVVRLDVAIPAPTTFGVDDLGRVYVGAGAGAVYRLDPAP